MYFYSGDMNQAIKNNRIFQTSFSDTDGIGSILPPKSKMNLIEERLTKGSGCADKTRHQLIR